jgi:hypothetical protein
MSPRGSAMSDEIPTAEQILEDPSASFWLKSTVHTALDRDPVDALNDALVLAAILDGRLRTALDLQELE